MTFNFNIYRDEIAKMPLNLNNYSSFFSPIKHKVLNIKQTISLKKNIFYLKSKNKYKKKKKIKKFISFDMKKQTE